VFYGVGRHACQADNEISEHGHSPSDPSVCSACKRLNDCTNYTIYRFSFFPIRLSEQFTVINMNRKSSIKEQGFRKTVANKTMINFCQPIVNSVFTTNKTGKRYSKNKTFLQNK